MIAPATVYVAEGNGNPFRNLMATATSWKVGIGGDVPGGFVTPSGIAVGNTLNDIVIAADCKSVQLRAERDGNGDGRVYTITFKVTDASGNVGTATATVLVPHSEGSGPAVDSGSQYVVLGSCP